MHWFAGAPRLWWVGCYMMLWFACCFLLGVADVFCGQSLGLFGCVIVAWLLRVVCGVIWLLVLVFGLLWGLLG